MNQKKRPQMRAALPYADFVRQVNRYRQKGTPDSELARLLRMAVTEENNMPKAFSLLRELICRKLGLFLFDTQIAAARSMQLGRIAELPTGEGKTLAAVVTAAILALQGRRVHILVFNDYLAHRDYSENLPVYEACGLRSGYLGETTADRKAAYACDVLYVPAKEAGFDCLRDLLCTEKKGLLWEHAPVALVDEADSILIDEARIPLVLAGNAEDCGGDAARAMRAVDCLQGHDVGLDLAANQVWLTESGIEAAETALHMGNLFLPENRESFALLSAALEARFLVERDRDYIVKDGAVLIVDAATGRVAQNRRFPDLLQQAVEMRELRKKEEPSLIYNSMSMQAFLQQYDMLCGMTGTAASSARELWGMYELKVDVMPPHVPCIRRDYPDEVFQGRVQQEQAVAACVQKARAKGQPVLVGTGSVQESERLSALLGEQGLSHHVLNAKNDEQEAELIANAGMPGRITISTNMAGRGVDIRLGGRDKRQSETARAAGGLLVIGTGMGRSLRTDYQLRGRAGRQGDPGESRFFLCMEDFPGDHFLRIEDYPERCYPKLLRTAQRRREGADAEARYMLERYSEVQEEQRKQITDYRTQVLLEHKKPDILIREDPAFYEKLISSVGKKALELAERQLTLYFAVVNWASYLAALEDKRSGIHLMLVGGKNPLEEYRKFAVSAFSEMQEDIKQDVVRFMKRCVITENGVDMEKYGLTGATTTWTYMIDESAGQFSRVPHLVRNVTGKIRSTVFSVQRLLEKFSSKCKGVK